MFDFDKGKFEELLQKSGITKKRLAEALGINESTLHRKINNEGNFDRKEIGIIVDFAKIENPMEIFFADKLAEMQETG